MGIITFGVAESLPNPVGFVRSLRQKIARLDSIGHPGRAGRVVDTMEWVLTGLPYIVVFTRTKKLVKVYRVLHAARQWPAQ